MKRKLLLALGLLLSASFVKGQFSPFNRTINVNLNRGVSPANDTTAAGVASPKYYESPLPSSLTNIQGRFFPNITDGSMKLRALCYQTDAEFSIINNKLSIKNSLAATGSAKFAAYNIQNADGVVKFSFDLDLTNYTGAKEFVIAFGSSSVPSVSNLTNGNSLTTSAPVTDIFASFRIVKSGSNFITQYRSSDGLSNVSLTTANSLIKAAQSQRVEIFANNTASNVNYVYGSPETTVTLVSNTYHVYVDGVKYSDNFPKVGTAFSQSLTINAVAFGHVAAASTGTQETVKISNISVTYPATTLPVSLTSFTGENTASGIRLNWKTASEQNNSHFELLRAGEDKNFKFISRINGKGNSDAIQNYSYTDNNPLNGNNYYQLKQVDFDGTETIYNQLVAVKSSLNNQKFKVYVNEEGLLNAYINASSYTIAKITVYDISGKKVFESNQNLQAGDNAIKIAIPTIQAGVYVARITANGLNAQTKFVKK
ncbi:hypothetical protein PBAC_05560 [Pedobacter glucosidilyticus]|nr:T9SS type A sorting domain-containing protein [Pedobacter glucosidilyticus]KHJ39242.1 hypothetical protein PBAC_05560 [Pedobacter glucosidilyticus]